MCPKELDYLDTPSGYFSCCAPFHFSMQNRLQFREVMCCISAPENVVCFGVELKFVKAYYLPHQFVSRQNEFILHFTVGQLKLDQAHNHGYVLDPFME